MKNLKLLLILVSGLVLFSCSTDGLETEIYNEPAPTGVLEDEVYEATESVEDVLERIYELNALFGITADAQEEETRVINDLTTGRGKINTVARHGMYAALYAYTSNVVGAWGQEGMFAAVYTAGHAIKAYAAADPTRYAQMNSEASWNAAFENYLRYIFWKDEYDTEVLKIHNTVVKRVLARYTITQIRNMSYDALYDILLSQMTQAGGYTPSNYTVSKYKNAFTALSNSAFMNVSSPVRVADQMRALTYPAMENEYRLLSPYIDAMSTLWGDDLIYYTQEYSHIINTSTTGANKKVLRGCLAVCLSQKLMWKPMPQKRNFTVTLDGPRPFIPGVEYHFHYSYDDAYLNIAHGEVFYIYDRWTKNSASKYITVVFPTTYPMFWNTYFIGKDNVWNEETAHFFEIKR